MTKFAKFFNGKKSETLAEARKKKKISIIAMLVTVAVCVVFVVLFGVIQRYTEADIIILIMPVSIAAVLVFIFFFLKLNCARKEIFVHNNHFCSKCGQHFTFENTTYTETTNKTTSSKNQNGITSDTYTYVKINCKCPKCGNEHSFDYDFLTKRVKKNNYGAVISEDNFSLDDRVKEHFDW